jgi:hypothetical protein
MLNTNKAKNFSVYISNKETDSFFITITEETKIVPGANDIGFYEENGNIFKIEGDIITDLFYVTDKKKSFKSKMVTEIKKDGKKLPYLETYTDYEWIFIYECGELCLFNTDN